MGLMTPKIASLDRSGRDLLIDMVPGSKKSNLKKRKMGGVTHGKLGYFRAERRQANQPLSRTQKIPS